jgi:hypothetical protein
MPGAHRRGHTADRAVHDGVKGLRITDPALRGRRRRLRTRGAGDADEHGNDCQDDGPSAGEEGHRDRIGGTSHTSPQGDAQCSAHCGAMQAGDAGRHSGEPGPTLAPSSRSDCYRAGRSPAPHVQYAATPPESSIPAALLRRPSWPCRQAGRASARRRQAASQRWHASAQMRWCSW